MRQRLNIFRDVADAWKNLSRRPLRSFLSSLGIGIGITALITMMSISEGAKQAAMARMDSLGVNTIRLENAFSKVTDGRLGNLSQGLRYRDKRLMSLWLGERGVAGAFIKNEGIHISYGQSTLATTVVGTDATWFAAENLKVRVGRTINRGDLVQQTNCAVVGSSLAAEMGLELLSVIRLNNTLFSVVGIAGEKGRLLTEGTGLSTLDFDASVYVPMSAMPDGIVSTVADVGKVDGIVVELDTPKEGEVFSLAEQLNDMLLQEHFNVEDFRIVVPYTLIKRMRESQRLFAVIMGVIASLSLLVGGIGVMNIMLANIAEQTREIGLRMAIGASQRRIISLYLWNSVLLTLAGCCWGMLLGVVGVLLISRYAGWDVAFSAFGLWLGPVSALITGLLFGLHPAMRAARLNPVSALRES